MANELCSISWYLLNTNKTSKSQEAYVLYCRFKQFQQDNPVFELASRRCQTSQTARRYRGTAPPLLRAKTAKSHFLSWSGNLHKVMWNERIGFQKSHNSNWKPSILTVLANPPRLPQNPCLVWDLPFTLKFWQCNSVFHSITNVRLVLESHQIHIFNHVLALISYYCLWIMAPP